MCRQKKGSKKRELCNCHANQSCSKQCCNGSYFAELALLTRTLWKMVRFFTRWLPSSAAATWRCRAVLLNSTSTVVQSAETALRPPNADLFCFAGSTPEERKIQDQACWRHLLWVREAFWRALRQCCCSPDHGTVVCIAVHFAWRCAKQQASTMHSTLLGGL